MPKVDTTVGELVAKIKNGELRLPEMQRRYIWPATRVRDLLDSLYRGYPSGTILVWDAEREMPSRDLAISQETSPFRGHQLLLDGQQRLTSLSAILRGEPVGVRNRKRPIEILFNLDHPEGPPTEVIEIDDDTEDLDDGDAELEEDDNAPTIQQRLKLRVFVVSSKALLSDPRWIRVSDVFRPEVSDAQLLKRLVKSFDDPLFEKYSRRLQDVRKIRDYPYVVHVLGKALSYEEVAEIFVRVNSLGMKLRGSDLALAQITSRWQGALKLFEEFQEECEENWFTFDLGLLARALVVFTTDQSRFKTAGTIPIGRLQEGWEKAKAGIRFSVNFLRSNAGIEDESLLSSPVFAITLGYYAMHREYRLSRADEAGLRRWLYIANARGHYSVSSETILDADLSLIARGGLSGELLESLRQQVGRFEIEAADLEGRGKRSALFAMAYLALKEQGARDWRTRLGLSLTHQGRLHFIEHHHIFPKMLLKKAGYDKGEINEIANMAFVTGGTNRSLGTTPADKYLNKVAAEQGDEALRAHCIPTDSSMWSMESFRTFLQYRRASLAKVINAFIESAASSGDTLQIGDLIAGGENARVEFKSTARWDLRDKQPSKALEAVIVKTVAGFLNAKGGVLIIGVSDDGIVTGLDDDIRSLTSKPDRDGYQQFLINLVSTALGKQVCSCLDISFPVVGGQEVSVIRVEASPAPVYVGEGAQARFYVRTGNTTQELGTREMVSYIERRWGRGSV